MVVEPGSIVVVAQKVISKAEGRAVRLDTVSPGKKARSLAERTNKDPRLVELILTESNSIVRCSDKVIITENRLGIVMANAGIDQSNIGEGFALLLPINPDESARAIREEIRSSLGMDVGVVISDSTGRAWRNGVVGIAIGVSNVPAILDLRGRTDLIGRELMATEVGYADCIATAANLVMGQADEGQPVVIISGLPALKSDSSATDILRDKTSDLFR